jgi:hypothetical protein
MIIRKILPSDAGYIDQICELLTSSYDPAVSKFLIYRDSNYRNYLVNSLGGSRDYIFVALSATAELMGFTQVRVLDFELFLNNIITAPGFQGANVASGLLDLTIKDMLKDGRDIKTFALDVFERNADVLKWYLRLGMKLRSTRCWYDLSDEYEGCAVRSGSNRISVEKDEAGFTQVYSGDVRIGTLVGGDRLLLRSEIASSVLEDLKGHFKNELAGLCLITDKELSYPLIDRSFQLQVEIADLKFRERRT